MLCDESGWSVSLVNLAELTCPMQFIDTSGLAQPGPVVKTRRALKAMRTGEKLELLANDPDCLRYIPAFCSNNGHHLLNARQEDGIILFEIEKGQD